MRPLSSWKKIFIRVAPYASEFGAVVFTASAIFGLLAIAGEFLEPGFAINHVSPKGMFAVLAFSGCLALVPGRPASAASRPSGALYTLLSAAAVVGSTAASWYYFGPLPEARLWLTAATMVTVGAVLWCAARRPVTDTDRKY